MRFLFLILLLFCGCNPGGPYLVAYVSQDQVYAEPILEEFSSKTGIKVRAVYDSEIVKTTGLINRLLAEKSSPQCDILWNNEDLRPQVLLAERVASSVTNFGFRSRRVIVNTNKSSIADAPQDVLEFTNARFKGKIVMAYPLFGTTASHMTSLKVVLGQQAWERWCKSLIENEVLLVDGNSMVVQFVARGDALFGITDHDDVVAGQRQGFPIAALPLGDGCYYTQNSVVLISGSKRRAQAEQLAGYLAGEEVKQQLIEAGALERISAPPCPRTEPNKVFTELPTATKQMEQFFLRSK